MASQKGRKSVSPKPGATAKSAGSAACRPTRQKLEETLVLLRKMTGTTIQAIHRMVEMRDPYTGIHQRRAADLARAIAQKLGLSRSRVDGIRLAALLHDIGKIVVPAEILNKPGRLTHNEFELIKDHVPAGFTILKGIDFSWPIARIVLQHHERLDGSGYPGGLTGKDILLEAKILSVADVVETMSSHRPYSSSLGIEKAIEEITEKSGRLYDPEVVEACRELHRKNQFHFKVDSPELPPVTPDEHRAEV